MRGYGESQMPLRHDLESQPETLQEMELAAEDKYWEGLELMVTGRGGGGIYLMGYVAEMLLKIAYFRFTDARPADHVPSRLGPARTAGNHLIPGIGHENYHSLRFWALLLFETRNRYHKPLPSEVEALFVQRTRRLYQTWWVEMRYRRDQSLGWNVRSVYDDVTWLRDNYAVLWR